MLLNVIFSSDTAHLTSVKLPNKLGTDVRLSFVSGLLPEAVFLFSDTCGSHYVQLNAVLGFATAHMLFFIFSDLCCDQDDQGGYNSGPGGFNWRGDYSDNSELVREDYSKMEGQVEGGEEVKERCRGAGAIAMEGTADKMVEGIQEIRLVGRTLVGRTLVGTLVGMVFIVKVVEVGLCARVVERTAVGLLLSSVCGVTAASFDAVPCGKIQSYLCFNHLVLK